MSKIKIKELPWFDSVAKVIGEGQAQIEIMKVIHSNTRKHCDFTGAHDCNCFHWDGAPQESRFWANIINGINPVQRD